ncbi:MAG: hypothetical protein CTY29_06225 [Methylobacter sp.]|nr:MAG: hypothetical protein CTY29_06225 [Methylobacter sp.]
MRTFLSGFGSNLYSGLKMALWLPVRREQFVFNTDQLVLLVLLDLLLGLTTGYLTQLPEPEFDYRALAVFCLSQSAFFLLMYGLSRLWRAPNWFVVLCVLAFSANPLMNVLYNASLYLQVHGVALPFSVSYAGLGLVVTAYCLLVFGRSFYIASERRKGFTVLALTLLLASSLTQQRYFGDDMQFWYARLEESEEGFDPLAQYRDIDAEAVMYRQPVILGQTLAGLKPGRKGVSEVFYAGFASYATQDVFLKEVTFIKDLFDRRFGTQQHSVNLVNHLSTLDSQPLANSTNLAATLRHLGTLMDKDEDVLVLYLTSHGSPDHRLSVDFWPLGLTDITPETLRGMLDKAGIKWRVIVISACYSGGFVDALKSEETLVATAASADRTSFGCGSKSEFTYFGEALFKDELAHQFSFVSAVENAKVIIEQREQSEQISASMPQNWVGAAIKTKLEQLSGELRQRVCTGAETGVC